MDAVVDCSDRQQSCLSLHGVNYPHDDDDDDDVYICMCMCVHTAVDNVLQRMTIVGVLLSFRCLAQEALLDVSTSPLLSTLSLLLDKLYLHISSTVSTLTDTFRCVSLISHILQLAIS